MSNLHFIRKLLFTFYFCLLFSTSYALTLYVDANNSDCQNANGASWSTAFCDLQQAINVAQTNDQIWVREGTYYPDGGTGDRARFYQVNFGQQIYGGFPTANTNPNPTFADRDPSAYPTILSGEIGDPNDLTDNSVHVIAFLNIFIAILDGFTIEKGYADGSVSVTWNANGGGLLIEHFNSGANVPPANRVSNCIFQNNFAQNNGGGVYQFAGNNNGMPSKFATVFESCIFQNNEANTGGGINNFAADANNQGLSNFTNCQFLNNNAAFGAGVSDNGGNSGTTGNTYTNCTFSNNTALTTGGGMDCFSGNGGASTTNFYDCTFSNNKAVSAAAGLNMNANGGTMGGIIRNCQFLNNGDETAMQPTSGGGLFMIAGNNGMCTAMLENNTFSNNFAQSQGGGINLDGRNNGNCTPTFEQCTFNNNKTNLGSGGAIFMWGGEGNCSPQFTASTFENNEAGNDGGAVCTSALNADGGSTKPSFTRCTFRTNTAAAKGGAVALFGSGNIDCNPTFTDCFFRENVAHNEGGGVYNGGNFKGTDATPFRPQFTRCQFVGNIGSFGGGAYNTGNNNSTFGLCEPNFAQCLFFRNDATSAGTQIYNEGAQGDIGGNFTNCIFRRGLPVNNVGALIVNSVNQNPGHLYTTFNHCTISSTSTANLVSNINALPNFYNSIIWGNGTDAMTDNNSTPSVSNCTIRNTSLYPSSNNSNLNVDPLLVWSIVDYQPRCSSPILDLGFYENGAITTPEKDFNNRVRTTNAQPDMGAVELNIANDYFTAIVGETGAMTATADFELDVFDLENSPQTWTYYLDCDAIAPGRNVVVLGISKNGNDLGTIGEVNFIVNAFGDDTSPAVDLSNADYVTNPTGYFVMNRYWEVQNSNPLTNPYVGVRQFYTDNSAAQVINGTNIMEEEDMYFFKITNAAPHATCVLNCGGSFQQYQYDKFTGTDTQWTIGFTNDGNTVGFSPGLKYAEYAVTSFSGGGGGSSGNGEPPVLPLDLLNFSGESFAKNNLIYWLTTNEKNVSHFELQRSADGKNNWETIGKVAAQGFSYENQRYQTIDNQPFISSFYRLKIVEYSGEIDYSAVINIQQQQANELKIVPNPARQQIQLQGLTDGEEATIIIYDVFGKIQLHEKVALHDPISITHLATGTYWVKIKSLTKIFTTKILVQ